VALAEDPEAEKDQPKPAKDDGGNGNGVNGNGATEESAWTALLKSVGEKLVTVLFTAGSLVGFVAFAGSVVLWTRFFAIHVPPDQVVAAVPRGESIAVGSVMLLLFGFFGVIATLAVYLIDRGGRTTPGMSRGLLVILALEAAIAIWIAGDSSPLEKAIASEVLAIVFGAVLWCTFVGGLIELEPGEVPGLEGRKDEREQPLPERAFWKRGDKSGVELAGVGIVVVLGILAGAIAFTAMRHHGHSSEWAWAIALGAAGAVPLFAVVGHWARFEFDPKQRKRKRRRRREERQEESNRDTRKKPPRFGLTTLGALVVVPLGVVAVLVPSLVLGQWWLAVSFVAIAVIGCGLWRIATLTQERFLWLGLAVFLSVPLFGTVMLMARNLADPQVQAVALIRSGDGPSEAIQGLYVTETSDRVYFASVATEGCSDTITPASGRLLWVPKKEVVAMSIGPLEDVEDAGRAALEMAYALTPAVETPTGEKVSLSVAQEPGGSEGELAPAASSPSVASSEGDAGAGGGESGGGAGEEGDGGAESGENDEAAEDMEAGEGESGGDRLQSAGPAVRPNFGAGLKLSPAIAEPGDVVQLRMSAPNPDVGGFGKGPAGYNLRLNGVRLAVLRVPARQPQRAEYVKTVGNRVLPLDGYFKTASEGEFVRVDPKAIHNVTDVDANRGGFTLKLDSDGRLAPLHVGNADSHKRKPPTVTLPNGTTEDLRYVLLRRAWSPTRIKFRVPDNAVSGIVSVECGQLAGQPVLTVVHPPVARVTVRMRPDSDRVVFDSGHSADEGEGTLERHWTIAGRHMGHKPHVSVVLPPRLSPYSASLTIDDSVDGLSDTVQLRVLRLPASRFPFGSDEPGSEPDVQRVREALRTAIEEKRPAAIELDGHADSVGGDRPNAHLSYERAERLRELLFKAEEDDSVPLVNGGSPVPMVIRAFGESCPIVDAPGPQAINRRVEVFLLGPGATVASGDGCHADRTKRTSW
jgi:outer membrane protein OmpA-like peptidoglycan-associated protein/MFS family permease